MGQWRSGTHQVVVVQDQGAVPRSLWLRLTMAMHIVCVGFYA